MNLHVIIVYFISAINGDVDHEIVSSKPMTLTACIDALSDRGPVPVQDGLAQFPVCQKVEDKGVST